jgi:hypothetical protein
MLTTRISIQASIALVHMLQHNHTLRLMQHTHCLCPSFNTARNDANTLQTKADDAKEDEECKAYNKNYQVMIL